MENNRPVVLCVDDEAFILNALKRLLRKENYTLLTAGSAQEALALLSTRKVQVVVSDQRMPKMDGVTFLKKVKEAYPDIVRITLTGYTDVDSIREAINQGHIYKFLLKPWNDDNLILEIRQALQQYELVNDNRLLNQKVLAQNEELKRLNEHLESLVKERTEELQIRNQVLELEQAILAGLPYPIIGVSEDGVIVMTNAALEDFFGPALVFQVGKSLQDYFPGEVVRIIQQSLADNVCIDPIPCSLGGIAFDLRCIQLTGQFQGKGIILSFEKRFLDS